MARRQITARAPGKLAVLGEYAVLDGAPALVLAVDRYCRAKIVAGDGPGACRLETRSPEPERRVLDAAGDSGIPLVDLVRRAWPDRARRGFTATLDSRQFFIAGRKLGLGSSAAALTAWAGAWAAWLRRSDTAAEPVPSLAFLIDLHRRFQGGSGSGLDVAAAFTGGAIVFRLDAGTLHHVGSVRLPKGVGFAGIFAGRSASTPDFVARYERFKRDEPDDAAAQLKVLRDIAEAGCAAAGQDEEREFLSAIDAYGRQLDVLGRAIGADIVTREHRAIGVTARRFGVTYKVSGAGGGDVGVALAVDGDALAAFVRAVREQGYEAVDLKLDRQGLVVEELT